MKFRTDFVTNSSYTSYITIHVKSKRMEELLGVSPEVLNGVYDRTNEFYREEQPFCDSIFQPFLIDRSCEMFNCRTLSEYLVFWFMFPWKYKDDEEVDENDEEFIQSVSYNPEETKLSALTDNDFEYVEINHINGFEGIAWTLEYIKVNNGKK